VFRDFRQFLLRGNVVDLAVGVVMGTAFGQIVTKLVADLLTPLIAATVGKPDFGALSFTIHNAQFRYGDFLNAVITFVLVAVAVFFLIVKPVNYVSTLAIRQDSPNPATRKCPYCLSEVPKAATRCAFCTSEIDPEEPPTSEQAA